MNHTGAQQDDPVFLKLSEFATNVTVRRAELGISQVELAAKSGLSRAAISDVERVVSLKTTYGTLLRIANALETTVEKLFEPTEQATPDDDELLRRASANDDEFIDARVLHKAIAERDEQTPLRFSKAGRPRTTTRPKARQKRTLDR